MFDLTWTDVAQCLWVSRWTLYRRLAEYGLPLQGYSSISDADLDSLVREIKSCYSNDGEVLIAAHVRAHVSGHVSVHQFELTI